MMNIQNHPKYVIIVFVINIKEIKEEEEINIKKLSMLIQLMMNELLLMNESMKRSTKTTNKHQIKSQINKPKVSDDEFNFPDTTKATQFQGFYGRLVGCNGDCGSKIGKIIDCCVHHKV